MYRKFDEKFYFQISFSITIYNQEQLLKSDELFKINYRDNISEINPLSPKDAVLDYGPLGNFSLAGFEMVLTRYVSTYIITYYLPSGGARPASQILIFSTITFTKPAGN